MSSHNELVDNFVARLLVLPEEQRCRLWEEWNNWRVPECVFDLMGVTQEQWDTMDYHKKYNLPQALALDDAFQILTSEEGRCAALVAMEGKTRGINPISPANYTEVNVYKEIVAKIKRTHTKTKEQ